ncbi:MAG TPA: hypothetical protein PJ982_16080, partial [Lacipirellulaceae bacterium]|nr:hypothetical protein [Lacipirellulaceae bacterium]
MKPGFRVIVVVTICVVGVIPRQSGGQSVTYHFNTDLGTVVRNGLQVADVNGVFFQPHVVDGVQQFRFLGDLMFLDGQTVTASGSRP